MSSVDEFKFEYYNHQDLQVFIHDLEREFPGLVKIHEIGRSHRNREIMLLEISDFSTKIKPSEKTAYYIDANIHAEEILGTTVALYTAWKLLTDFSKDDAVKDLLKRQVFYIVPRVNPDGAEIVLNLPFYEWIGNGRYLPGEEQFGAGLHYKDINGDGEILDMRYIDEAGEWKISKKDPRIMVPREVDEYGGTYYRIVPEGIIEDWDGGDFEIPRPQDGNMNRNFPANWESEAVQYGSGELPMSEPEVKAVVNWVKTHANIAGIQCYHTHSGVILRPWLTKPDSAFKGDDRAIFEVLGKMGTEETGYPVISVYEDFTPDKSLIRYGSSTEWHFGMLGIPAFNTELWNIFEAAGIKLDGFYPLKGFFDEEEMLKLLKWQEEECDGSGFMPWTPFEHPQLGPVEIGGWRRLFTFRNPPSAGYIEKIARTNAKFTFRHAGAAPRIEISSTKIEKIADNIFKIDAVVKNTGFLPSNLSAEALERKEDSPVNVKLTAISGEGFDFIEGKESTSIGHLAGRSNRTSLYTRFYDFSKCAARIRWIVKLSNMKTKISICAGNKKSGFDIEEINLEDYF